MAKGVSYARVLWESATRPRTVRPPAPIPSMKSTLAGARDKTVITWFGHSSYLIEANGKNILVDPVMSGHASPFSWMIRAFAGADIYVPEELPPIDALIITHNHFDHLDTQTLRKLVHKVSKVYTSLGVARNLQCFDADIVVELDWFESLRIDTGVELTALPARHFSGRGLKRNGSLWSSFALSIADQRIFIGGDSGYDGFFRDIGERYGPFDIAMLECGQYNPFWPFIHMMPEETVQAAIDLRASWILPVHWGKFALANHPWNEPVIRLLARARDAGLQVTTPMIGEQVVLNETYPVSHWWEQVKQQS